MLNAKFSEINEPVYIKEAKNKALYFEIESDFSLKKDQILTNIRNKKVKQNGNWVYENVVHLYKVTGFGDSYYKDFNREQTHRRVYIERVKSAEMSE